MADSPTIQVLPCYKQKALWHGKVPCIVNYRDDGFSFGIWLNSGGKKKGLSVAAKLSTRLKKRAEIVVGEVDFKVV